MTSPPAAPSSRSSSVGGRSAAAGAVVAELLAERGAAFGDAAVHGGVGRAGEAHDLGVAVAEALEVERFALAWLQRAHRLHAGVVLDAFECVLLGAAAVAVARLGQFAWVRGGIGGGGEGAGGPLARDGAESPGLVHGDGGQPATSVRVERDVGAAQQRHPGDLAGVFDDSVTDAVDAAADRALQPLGVVAV